MARRPDSYTRRAKKENFLARSVYKLQEIDNREKLFQGAERILDLGAAPGSWSQFCVQRCPTATVLAIDINPLKFTHPRVRAVQAEITADNLDTLIGGERVDVVLSDMAPKTTGIHETDVARSQELAMLAVESARRTLKPGGKLVAKLFMGEGFEEFDRVLKESFQSVRKLRPESTRKHSREIFFIASGFKGR